MVFNQKVDMSLLYFTMMASPMKKKEETGDSTDGSGSGKKSSEVSLEDCIQEFKQTETLDEDNKWYCNKCKDFVQADKTLEIYRIPRILVVSLKRFKTAKSKYGYGLGGQKLDTLVEFPLNGLDLRPFVLS